MSIILPTIFTSILLLLVRLLLTITFFAEARIKFKDLKGFAKGHGLPIWLSFIVALAELLAAISMFTGLLSPWAGLGLVLLMLITTSMQIFKWHAPYWASKRGFEYDLIMLVLAAVIVIFGAGVIAF